MPRPQPRRTAARGGAPDMTGESLPSWRDMRGDGSAPLPADSKLPLDAKTRRIGASPSPRAGAKGGRPAPAGCDTGESLQPSPQAVPPVRHDALVLARKCPAMAPPRAHAAAAQLHAAGRQAACERGRGAPEARLPKRTDAVRCGTARNAGTRAARSAPGAVRVSTCSVAGVRASIRRSFAGAAAVASRVACRAALRAAHAPHAPSTRAHTAQQAQWMRAG